ncbi:MAG: RNA chaperone ProQ [Lonepinella koalarum]|nr:RNA chaperone ProQ [Lonepinella koalarum]
MTDIQQVESSAQTTEQIQEHTSKLSNKEIIAYLAEKFPLCFTLEGEAKPLKIGLFQDLAEALKEDDSVSKTQLRHALRQYTSNWRYLHGCRLGAERVDLQGNPAGILEQEHADHAAQQLAEAKAKFAEKKAAERAANPKPKKQFNHANKLNTKGKKPSSRKQQVKQTKLGNVEQLQLNAFDFTHAKEGDRAKIKVGEQVKSAVILEVIRDGARVQLDNGLILTVAQDRLFA